MNKKRFFRVLSVVLAFATLLCITGCGEDREARNSLEDMLDMLREGKYTEAMARYVPKTDSGRDFLNSGGKFDKESFPAYDMHMALFKSIKYEILSSDVVSENEIHFKTRITTLDLSPVGEELAQTAAAYNISTENAEADEKLSEEELNNILNQQMVNISEEYLGGDNIEKETSEIEISMYYDPVGRWMVHVDEDLAEVLTGGVYSAYYEELSKAEMIKKE